MFVPGSSRSGHSCVRAPSVRCALVAENTPDGFCNTLLHKASGVRPGFGTRALPKVAGAAGTDGLKADTIKLPGVHEFEGAEFAGAAVTDGLMADTIKLPDVYDFEGAEFAGAAATEDQGEELSAAGVTGESGIIGLLDVPESDFSKNLAKSTASDVLTVSRLSSNSSGVSSHACVSYLDALLSAPACAPAALTAARCVAPLSAVVGLDMHVDDSSVHGACNSWSDTGRVKGPTGRRCSKGGVSGPAEDLRPVSEEKAGVNFRPAGRVRGQVAGSLPGRQPGTGTRANKGSVVTPSLHPEVPDSLSVSPGPGRRIRQLMGWTKVCGTTQSGIWVLKGNARTCMFPANLDHLRWDGGSRVHTRLPGPGHDCLCSYKYGHGATVRPQTNKAIWDGVISLWAGSRPSYHLGVIRGNCQRG